MQTWFFQLDTDPLTPWQIEQLDTPGGASPVSLSSHPDGTIAAAVEADTLKEAFTFAKLRINDAIGKRAAITALYGALGGSVADVVFRASAKLTIDESTLLEAHLAAVWYRVAYDMAVHGAVDEQHFDAAGNPKRKLVVRPTPSNEMVSSEVVMIWELVYGGAKAYLEDYPILDGTEARP